VAKAKKVLTQKKGNLNQKERPKRKIGDNEPPANQKGRGQTKPFDCIAGILAGVKSQTRAKRGVVGGGYQQ